MKGPLLPALGQLLQVAAQCVKFNGLRRKIALPAHLLIDGGIAGDVPGMGQQLEAGIHQCDRVAQHLLAEIQQPLGAAALNKGQVSLHIPVPQTVESVLEGVKDLLQCQAGLQVDRLSTTTCQPDPAVPAVQIEHIRLPLPLRRRQLNAPHRLTAIESGLQRRIDRIQSVPQHGKGNLHVSLPSYVKGPPRKAALWEISSDAPFYPAVQPPSTTRTSPLT